MKRAFILVAILALIAAGCGPAAITDIPAAADTPSQSAQTPAPSPTPSPTAAPTGAPTVEWTLPGAQIAVNVPEAWGTNAELLEMLTENPDVAYTYAVAFRPADIELAQEANVGFFYVVLASIWDAQEGVIADIPVNEIGRTEEYVVGYAGVRDNPYIIDSPEDKLFGEMIVPTQGSAEVLSVGAE